MIQINSYAVTERAVYQGVSVGVEKLLQDVQSFNKPEQVVSTITKAVLEELMEVYDFGVQQLRLTPDMMLKLLASKGETTSTSSTNLEPVAPEQ